MKRMDAANTAKIYGLPRYESQGIPNEESTEEKRSWFFRRLVDIGVIQMAANPKPPGFYFNYSTVAVLLTIFGTILGGIAFVYNMTWNAAYQKGLDDADKKATQERILKVEQENLELKKDIQKKIQLESFNNGAKEKK